MMSKKLSNRRRFDDDPIRSLETTFQTESRPELRLKHHQATKLGLHPRQVAIWFQNKRARSKSKQIQGDYCTLKSNYDKLTSQFQALRKENQNLLIQVERLGKMAEQREEDKDHDHDLNSRFTLATNENPRCVVSINSHEVCMPSCNVLNRKYDYLDEEEVDVLNMIQMASPENGYSFESCSQLWDL